MSAENQQAREAEARLKATAKQLDEALQNRDRALRETASIVNRRRASEIVGLSPGRVQQIINAPWTHRVRFVGIVDQDAARALSDAGIEIRTSHGGGSTAPGGDLRPLIKHTVYLTAQSSEQALAIVKRALENRGSFANFKVEAVSPN